MRNAEDYSILAWGLRSDKSQHRIGIPHRINSQGTEPQERSNPLAIDPDSFAPDPGGKLLHVSEFTYHGLDEWTHPANHDPPTTTARGLSISLPLFRCDVPGQQLWLAYIGCWLRGKAVCMPLRQVNPTTSTTVFDRLRIDWDDSGYYLVNPELIPNFQLMRICLRQVVTTNYLLGPRKNLLVTRRGGPVSIKDLHHCSQWKAEQCCQLGGCGANCHLNIGSPYGYFVCFTDERELFAVMLGPAGAAIHSLGTVDDPNRSLSAKQILEGKLNAEALGQMTRQEQTALLSMQDSLQERATCYFRNCAVTAGLKRRNEGSVFFISSRRTDLQYQHQPNSPPVPPRPIPMGGRQSRVSGSVSHRSKGSSRSDCLVSKSECKFCSQSRRRCVLKDTGS